MEDLQSEISKNKRVEKVINEMLAASADTKAEVWRKFISHWPLAKKGLGFSWDEKLRKFEGGVDATAIVENRYELQIILDLEVSSNYKDVTFVKLRFHFMEVEEVDLPAEGPQEGGVTVRFKPKPNIWFGEKEWNTLRDEGWNFGSIGVNVVSNAPVTNIEWALK
jgi:hypothetical protein